MCCISTFRTDKNPKHGYFQRSCECVVSNAYNESTVYKHGRELLMEEVFSARQRVRKGKRKGIVSICGVYVEKVGLVGISGGFVLALGSYEEQ